MQKLTREEKIILEIQNNPGIRFRELMKMIGITNGILSYYITKLEKIGTVHVERKSGVSRFFMPDLTDDELILTQYLRMSTPKKILLALLEGKKLTFKQITENIGMSPATTSFYLKKLVADKIVLTLSNSPKKYSICNEIQIANLISEYHPDLIENASVNLADIFSSY